MPSTTSENQISPDVFEQRLAALSAPKGFAIAVSGGRDSMALAKLSSSYAEHSQARVMAYTVDHGLRPESGEEAAQTAKWCERLGLEHRLLRWEGAKPETGLQAAARAARYRLLIDQAIKDGFDALLTAHSQDDQAETFFMRLARGAGVNGLAAMRNEVLVANRLGAPIRLLRPLLPFSRKSLTEFVADAGIEFVDDPSNDDPAFERVRVRALLAALQENGLLTKEAAARSAKKMAVVAQRFEAQTHQKFIDLGGVIYGWGGASLDQLGDCFATKAVVSRLIYAVGGGDYEPESGAAEIAFSDLCDGKTVTLGGAIIKPWQGRFWFMREPSALLGRAGVPAMEAIPLDNPLLWDNRFIIKPVGHNHELKVLPFGRIKTARDVHFYGPREARAGLPGILQAGELIAAAGVPSMNAETVRFKSLIEERFFGGIIRF